MKKTIHLLLIIASTLLFFQCHEGAVEKDNAPKKFKKRALRPDKPAEAAAHEMLRIKNPYLGHPTPENLVRIKDSLSILATYSRSFNSASWTYRGPYSVGGRTRAILIDDGDPSGNTVFAGGVAGGLWKCTDFLSESPTWSYVDVGGSSLPICAISQHPKNPDIMYFGTGEGYFNADSHRGLGIYKSSDGGTTWEVLEETQSTLYHYTQKLLVDSAGVVYAATRDGGLRRSEDDGATWKKVLGDGKFSFSNRGVDIEIASNGTLYATMGLGSPDGIYRSKDNGSTWTSLVDKEGSGLPRDSFERIEIAIAPSDSLRIYAVMQDEDNSCKGIYRSDDGGDTWLTFEAPGAIGMDNFARNQAWYDLTVSVDPSNPNVVYIGGVDIMQSTDGGATWRQVSQWYGYQYPYVHADQHQFIFFPGDPRKGISTNDGGVFLFETKDASQQSPYCVPLQDYAAQESITRVVFNDINHESMQASHPEVVGYSDHTSIHTTLKPDSTYTLEIEVSGAYNSHYTVAWIDWNTDGELSTEEIVFNQKGRDLESVEVKVPADCGHGETRLRVRYQYAFDWIPSPCEKTEGLGETEDYTIMLDNCKPGVPCSDGNACTTGDSLTVDCVCVGTLIDENMDGECDVILPPTFKQVNDGYNTTQFYALDIDPRAGNNYILGGTQDNGSHALDNTGTPTSNRVTGGDGAFCFIDKDEPNIQISSYVYNNYFITKDAFETYDWKNIGSGGRFINPCDYDSETNTLYAAYGTGYISRYRNVGRFNIQIDTQYIPALDSLLPSAFALDPHNADAVWVGTPKQRSKNSENRNVARIVRVTSGSQDSIVVDKEITFGLGTFTTYGYLRCIVPHPKDSLRMMLTFSNYGIKNVWETLDGGESWTAKDGKLPDMPVHWALYDPQDEKSVYIATEMGVWKTGDITADKVEWEPFGDIPLTRVSMMKYREVDHTLVAATHGRGIYQIKLDDVSTEEIARTELRVYPNPAVDVIKIDNASQWIGGYMYIYNIQGRKVGVEWITAATIQKDIAHLPQGVYAVTLVKGGHRVSAKIVKE